MGIHGHLPVGITPDNIKQSHDSRPFNPTIASVLYKTTWLESWGSGVKRMCDACNAQNVPEPYYEERPGGVAIIFKRAVPDTKNFGSDFGSQLSDRQKSILKILYNDGSITAKRISVMFGITQRTIEKDLSLLRKNGFIEKTTKDNRSPWKVLKMIDS